MAFSHKWRALFEEGSLLLGKGFNNQKENKLSFFSLRSAKSPQFSNCSLPTLHTNRYTAMIGPHIKQKVHFAKVRHTKRMLTIRWTDSVLLGSAPQSAPSVADWPARVLLILGRRILVFTEKKFIAPPPELRRICKRLEFPESLDSKL